MLFVMLFVSGYGCWFRLFWYEAWLVIIESLIKNVNQLLAINEMSNVKIVAYGSKEK
jgi:hypothetical protein